MEALRWLAGTLLVAFSALILIGNLGCLAAAALQKKHISFISFIGGLTGVAGFLTLPLPALNNRLWLPIAVDFTFPLLLVGAILQLATTSPPTIDPPKPPATPLPASAVEPPAHRTPPDNT